MRSEVFLRRDLLPPALLPVANPDWHRAQLLGQMAVSLVVMSLYVAIGLTLLLSFALLGLLDARRRL